MPTVTIILQVGLGIAFLAAGGGKIAGLPMMKAAFTAWGYPQWFRLVTGIVEVTGAIALIAGIFIPPLTFFAAVWLGLVMLGALYTHFVRAKDRGWPVPAALLALLLVVGYLQPLGLQILAIPRPVDMPQALVPAQEFVTYPAGAFLESIKLDQAGNLYLSHTTGVDLADPGNDQVAGQILKITPEGEAGVLARLPPGAFAGVIAFAPEGDLYLTVMAPKKPEYHGVWRFTPDGQGEPLATLPSQTGPNGLTFGPDGRLYMADANLGAIWRIEPDTGQARQWFQDVLLRKRPFVGLFPGANGLKFWAGDLYVSVSDKGHIVRIPLLADGRPGQPAIYATSVPTDDFAFDRLGNLYATTHPFNTIVRITPDGEQTIIATENEGVLGPTEVAFGTLPGDETTLYVATDGGLFEGRAEQRPNVVKLEVGVPGLVEQ